jgi:hypothetical protein
MRCIRKKNCICETFRRRAPDVLPLCAWWTFMDAVVWFTLECCLIGFRHNKAVTSPKPCVFGVVVGMAIAGEIVRMKLVLRLAEYHAECRLRVFEEIGCAGQFSQGSALLSHDCSLCLKISIRLGLCSPVPGATQCNIRAWRKRSYKYNLPPPGSLFPSKAWPPKPLRRSWLCCLVY